MIKNICFITFILISFSCSKSENTSNLFNEYLNETLNKEIPIRKMIFFIIDIDRCQGCVKTTIKKIKDRNIFNFKNCFFIFCTSSEILDDKINQYKKKDNVFIDYYKNFFKYNLSPFSDCIIITNNKEVIDIVEFNYKNIVQKYDKIIHNF